MDEEQARRILEQAHRAGLVDATLARRALEVSRAATPGSRVRALSGIGLAPQVVAALSGVRPTLMGPTAAPPGPGPTPNPTPSPAARTPNTTPNPGSAFTPRPEPNLSGSVRLPGADRIAAGRRIGPFTVEGELGRGGMGVVLRARHDDGRPAAVKLLLEGGSGASAARFQREVQALAALDHPNVVKLLGASPEGQSPPWLAMAFVEGEDLDKRLARGPLQPDEAARLLAEVALGVAHAHRRGVIHRDLKPSNVLLRAKESAEVGRAIVTDFGLAKGQDAERLTRTGSMVGTLAYMAPEQVRGSSTVAAPADVWALGAILYRALTGQEPFTGDSAMALAAAICVGSPVSPRKLAPKIPPDLEAVALACLVLDPAARPTAPVVAAALRSRRGLAGGARRGPLVAGLAALAVLTAAGVGLVLSRRTTPPGPTTTTATGTPSPTSASPGTSTASGPAPPAPGAWPAPPTGWRLAWYQAQGPAAVLAEPALWRGPDEAAPADLARKGEPEALRAAFAGEAAALGGGRVRVRHGEPARSLTVEVQTPAHYTSQGEPGACALEASGAGAARVLAPNDSSGLTLHVGQAAWAGARLAADVRLVEHVDNDNVTFDLGVVDGAPAGLLRLSSAGRTAALSLLTGTAPLRLGERFTRLAFAPGADAGERVLVDGVPVAGLDGLVALPARSGRVDLILHEVHLELRGLEVEGLPVTVDRPALARLPVDCGAGVRVAVGLRFQASDPASGPGEADAPGGGPFVALGEGPGALRFELDGPRVVLRTDGRLLAAAEELPAAPSKALLWLARDADALCGVVVATVAGKEHKRRLLVVHPLPLRTASAGYGSTGRAARFVDAALWLGPDDAARAAFDASPDGAGGDAADPRARWRRGALALAQASDPGWAERALVGAEATPRRVARARAAADDLDAAAAGLGDQAELRLDARARAVLARVLTTDATGAAAAARALVDDAGLARARELVEGLERDRGRPCLVERLIDGYATVADVPLREAALRAALILAPDAEAKLAVGLANNVRSRVPRPDPATPAGRAALEGALVLYEQARAKGADPKSFEAAQGDTLVDLGRHADAAARFESVTRHSPRYWWGWVRAAHCLTELHRPIEALERSLGALACAVTRRDIHQTLAELASLDEVQAGAPGLAAVALVALAGALAPTDPAAAERLRADARALAERVAQADGRDGDLATYALLCLEVRAPARPGDRPTAVLARARTGERADLDAARAADPLVDNLARLDPALAGKR